MYVRKSRISEQESKKRTYVGRLFYEAKEDLSLLEIFIDFGVMLMLTVFALFLGYSREVNRRSSIFMLSAISFYSFWWWF